MHSMRRGENLGYIDIKRSKIILLRMWLAQGRKFYCHLFLCLRRGSSSISMVHMHFLRLYFEMGMEIRRNRVVRRIRVTQTCITSSFYTYNMLPCIMLLSWPEICLFPIEPDLIFRGWGVEMYLEELGSCGKQIFGTDRCSEVAGFFSPPD